MLSDNLEFFIMLTASQSKSRLKRWRKYERFYLEEKWDNDWYLWKQSIVQEFIIITETI